MAGVFPKSGTAADGAANTLPDPKLVAGCIDLWYDTARCKPKLDPAQQNAMISEIINAVNCSGLPYDCNKLDNLCRAIEAIWDQKFLDCLPVLPTAAKACVIEQLVLTTDPDGCMKIARLAGSNFIAGATNNSVIPIGQSASRPVFPANPGTFYNINELAIAEAAGTIDASRLAQNYVLALNFTVDCDNTLLQFDVASTVIFNPAQNSPNGASGRMAYRFDGVFGGNGVSVPATVAYTNYQNSMESTFQKVLNKGAHTIELFACATGALQPAQLALIGSNTTSGGSIRVTKVVQ